mmetsp:Transcript_31886/g.35738  ORF Transcript_31886/g.35738 Transcript_31886/m.35738 type:complete len:89 (-) Transcript_31886:33-299(-)
MSVCRDHHITSTGREVRSGCIYGCCCPLAGSNTIPGVFVVPHHHAIPPSVPDVRAEQCTSSVVFGHDHDDEGHNPTVQSEHTVVVPLQ